MNDVVGFRVRIASFCRILACCKFPEKRMATLSGGQAFFSGRDAPDFRIYCGVAVLCTVGLVAIANHPIYEIEINSCEKI